jgi:hypothetical protein
LDDDLAVFSKHMKGTPKKNRYPARLTTLLFIAVLADGAAFAGDNGQLPHSVPPEKTAGASQGAPADLEATVRALDVAFQSEWTSSSQIPAAAAPSLLVVRRLSLALAGTVPSLQEIRALENLPEAERVGWWLSNLLADRRCSDYLAERFARAYAGAAKAVFPMPRRGRLVEWLSNEILQNRPYDQIVSSLIDSTGKLTTEPAMNFVFINSLPKSGPDEARLAARVARAFLGVRIDCVQCHEGKMGSMWQQSDFHQLAAFFAQAELFGNGLRDNPKKQYKVRYLHETSEEIVPPTVPWEPELMPGKGPSRQRLACWVTAPGNRPFARAIVNRTWALLFNRPLITPVDDIPLHGPFPPGLEILADDFTAHQCDLQRLIRVIAATRVFQLESRSADAGHPASKDAELHWATFPMTRLRPEQMVGSVLQASSPTTMDANAHLLFRSKQADFLSRYGDNGEDEFGNQTGTIPQSLLLMNGELVRHRIGVYSVASRIGPQTPDDNAAVEAAYLAAFSRRPTPEESEYFALKLHGSKGAGRMAVMSDLFWTLFNSTEFSWNH